MIEYLNKFINNEISDAKTFQAKLCYAAWR